VTESENFTFRVGATLKVRDAEIRLEQGTKTAFNDDLGLVPLLYLSAKRTLGERWTVGADLDGLAGGPGRAIDAGITLDYSLTNQWSLGVDARVLDGGADVDEVYNFAQFNSLASANLEFTSIALIDYALCGCRIVAPQLAQLLWASMYRPS